MWPLWYFVYLQNASTDHTQIFWLFCPEIYNNYVFGAKLPNILVIAPSSGDLNEVTLLEKDNICTKFEGQRMKIKENMGKISWQKDPTKTNGYEIALPNGDLLKILWPHNIVTHTYFSSGDTSFHNV